jgi:hypothetical protein
MCVQCMMGAMTAGATVSGARSWLGTRRWAWLTPRRLHRITVAMVLVGFALSATVLSGSS